jgi:hypothetical protein
MPGSEFKFWPLVRSDVSFPHSLESLFSVKCESVLLLARGGISGCGPDSQGMLRLCGLYGISVSFSWEEM